MNSNRVRGLFEGVVEVNRPPKLKSIQNRGKTYWRIEIGKNAEGKPLRPQVGNDEGEARKIFAEVCERIERGEISDALSGLDTLSDFEFKEVRRKLRPYNVRVSDAVDFFIKHHRPNRGIITVSEALAVWQEIAEREGFAEKTIKAMKETYAGPFTKQYGHLQLVDLNYEIAEEYIFETKKNLSAGSKKETISKLKGFLNKLAKNGYFYKELNPFEKLVPPKEKVGEGEEKDRLIEPEMLGALLEFALQSEKKSSYELGVGIVLVAFCGVRTTEVRRLNRSHIAEDLGVEGIRWKVRIPKHLAKWGHKRTIEVPSNAIEWFNAFRAKGFEIKDAPVFVSERGGGPLSEEGLKSRFSRFFEAFYTHGKEFPKYEQNGFRVSFGSYGAKFFGVSEVCEMMGERQQQTFWQHYREDAETKRARNYFALIPKNRRLQKIRSGFQETFGPDWKRELEAVSKEEWISLCPLDDKQIFPFCEEEIEEVVATAPYFDRSEEIPYTLTK